MDGARRARDRPRMNHTLMKGRRAAGSAALLALLVAAGLAAGPAQAEELASYTGAELYGRFCGSCHGAGGRGDGPVAATMKVEVPDLTRLARRPGGFPEEQVRRIIDGREVIAAHGRRSMPVWGYEFAGATVAEPDAGAAEAAALIERLVAHLRTLQRPPLAPAGGSAGR
jgi:mono/diheme cytochrome c family protein